MTVFSFSQLWTLRWNLFPLAMSNNNNNNKTYKRSFHSFSTTYIELLVYLLLLSLSIFLHLAKTSCQKCLGFIVPRVPSYRQVHFPRSVLHSSVLHAQHTLSPGFCSHTNKHQGLATLCWTKVQPYCNVGSISFFYMLTSSWQPMTKITMWNIKGKSFYAFPSWGLSSCIPTVFQ